jgi:hypothetical protein
MPRRRRNPFYALLGLAGLAFTLTATTYCLAVLRGVRPETSRLARTGLLTVMDRHGTAILVGELVVLAIATIGAVALDHRDGGR